MNDEAVQVLPGRLPHESLEKGDYLFASEAKQRVHPGAELLAEIDQWHHPMRGTTVSIGAIPFGRNSLIANGGQNQSAFFFHVLVRLQHGCGEHANRTGLQ